MSAIRRFRPARPRVLLAAGMLLLTGACAQMPAATSDRGLDQTLVLQAVSTANHMRAAGKRVWCVPFARNASGIEIRGNAHTWWDKAEGQYHRGHTPIPGAVMVFSESASLRLGHVAVVSQVISDREIKISHANWHRNRVSLDMAVIDVSEAGDWSRVRVESNPGSFGKVYKVDGFISELQREA